jgi:hypothetical protein
MKLNEIEVGGRYTAKVSGNVQVVKVVAVRDLPPTGWSRARTQIEAVNEATGRRITIRSPQRLRKCVDRGCEFCRRPFNRQVGAFTCPYCNLVWPATPG